MTSNHNTLEAKDLQDNPSGASTPASTLSQDSTYPLPDVDTVLDAILRLSDSELSKLLSVLQGKENE
jgi:hypothetical protein